MNDRPYILKGTSWKTIRKNNYKIAILPWGATEAHNYHLPYGTDIFETEHIAGEAAGIAWENGAGCMVLPSIPFGVNTQQLDIPFTVNMNPSTQAFVLEDIVDSLENHDVEKLVVLNGHGGNNFRQMIRELQRKTEIFLCTVDWFKIPGPLKIFSEPGDHAGEMETSLMMHLEKNLVQSLSNAGDGAAKKFKIAAFNEGWAWAPRQWTRITKDTGVGNPARATSEKGKKYFKALTKEIADFLIMLEKTDINEIYE